MNMNDTAMVKLRDTFIHVEFDGSLDESLRELSSMAGNVLDAKDCAIALLSETEVAGIGLRPGAHFGDPPMRRYKGRELGREQDVHAGREQDVHAGREQDAYAGCAGMRADTGNAYITAPTELETRVTDRMFSTLVIQGKIIGVIHAHQPQQRGCFSKDDLILLGILTLLITKAIQVIQLQNILKSRFAQIALTRSGNQTMGEIVLRSAQNPNHIARILARSFYREMNRAGFSFNQIIYAASEVISELSGSVRKHSAKRHLLKDGAQTTPPDQQQARHD